MPQKHIFLTLTLDVNKFNCDVVRVQVFKMHDQNEKMEARRQYFTISGLSLH